MSKYSIVFLIVLAIGAGYLFRDTFLIPPQKVSCADQLNGFETRMQEQVSATKAGLNPKLYDFVVGYSPTLKTCIGGFTTSESDTETHPYRYTYAIYDLSTNSMLVSYTNSSEYAKHAELQQNVAGMDAADGYASDEYRAKLTELTAGQIK